ncbi:UNVERIFIED_CONTAM: hypothetical protein Scaly_3042300 [Sesamum calycinum]|uniref:DDE Tnp4 domain-containing protein n=1 Tax=Sesamum calycinum TaxID=2727403 RepID=A0AAW2K6W5_9LAMI
MFLSILAHHKKNRTVKYDFIRSERIVSKHFHCVLNAVLRLHPLLLANPTPVPPNSSCPRWKWFEGSLGALDGMYIDVRVKVEDRAREGSSADNRVLRDAITRPTSLKIPRGNYYLVDGGYSNGEGFLSPYRGTTNTIDVKDDVFDNFAKHTAEIERSENVPVTPEYYVPTPDPSLYGDDDKFINSFTSTIAQPTVNRADTERVTSPNILAWRVKNHMLVNKSGVSLNRFLI